MIWDPIISILVIWFINCMILLFQQIRNLNLNLFFYLKINMYLFQWRLKSWANGYNKRYFFIIFLLQGFYNFRTFDRMQCTHLIRIVTGIKLKRSRPPSRDVGVDASSTQTKCSKRHTAHTHLRTYTRGTHTTPHITIKRQTAARTLSKTK